MPSPEPVLEQHGRWTVVRDDLLLGGTKSRALPTLATGRELVYAGPAWGGAAWAIANYGQQTGTAVRLFYPWRRELLPRQRACAALGAVIELVPAGRLNVLKARAREYCQRSGAQLLEWGVPQSSDVIAAAAARVRALTDCDEVWCAAGSGSLAKGLVAAFGSVPVIVVQVGAGLSELGAQRVIRHPLRFEQRTAAPCPFDSCRHYDAKAWELGQLFSKAKRPLFWNVMGDHR